MLARSLPLAMLSLVLLTSAATVEARGRKFSCPLPDKRSCMSTEQVYDLTGNGQDLEEAEPVETERRGRGRQSEPSTIPVMQPRPPESVGGQLVASPARCCAPVRTEVTIKGDTLAVASPTPQFAPSTATTIPVNYASGMQPVAYVTPSQHQDMVVRTSREEPFRAPAQVMRIYISPWEDEQGDLHMGGYVFSEIAPRRWNVGARAAHTSSGYRLLTMNSPARDAAQDAKTDSGDATAQVSRSE